MNKKLLVLVVGVVLAVVLVLALKQSGTSSDSAEQAVPTVLAIDVAVSFMDDWLDARQATDTDPVQAGLLTSEYLTRAFQEKLAVTEFSFEEGIQDPVLCQQTTPNNIRSKVIVDQPEQVQVYVIATKNESAGQAVATLVIEDGEWKINAIKCGFGETGPEMGEYSFEQTGQLLKTVPPPLDANFWYLVYESEGVFGYTAKLLFDDTSMCIAVDGTESVCDPTQFVETSRVMLQGDIGEAGVTVKRIMMQ